MTTSTHPDRWKGAPVYDVKGFGAAGDGKRLDSEAINRAIEACARGGGGIVRFPKGVYLSGSVRLKSGVALHLEEGATLLGAPNDIGAYDSPEPNPWEAYQDFGHSHFRNALIWAEGAEEIAVFGRGTIHGGGISRNDPPLGGGDKAISLRECKGVLVEGVRIEQGGHFAILATGCERVHLVALVIRTTRDGINIVGCRDVLIERCDVESVRYENGVAKGGDDAIVLKSDYSLGRRIDCAGVTVRDCRVASGCNGLNIGSETAGDFTDIRVVNLVVDQAEKAGIGITTNDGGVVDGFTCEGVVMRRVAVPVFLHVTARLRTPESRPPGRIRNVLFSHVEATDCFGYAKGQAFTSTLSGLGGAELENIRFEHLRLTSKGGGSLEESEIDPPSTNEYQPRALGKRPAYGFFARHVKGLLFRDVVLDFERDDLRPAILCRHVRGLRLDGVRARRAAGGAASVRAIDCDVELF